MLQRTLQRRQAAGAANFAFSFLNLNLGDLRWLSGDAKGAQTSYIAARDELLALMKKQANDPYLYDSLALATCGLGKGDAAIANAERAIHLLPASKMGAGINRSPFRSITPHG